METLDTAISFLLIVGLIVSPMAILIGLKRFEVNKYKFLTYLTLGVVVTSILTMLFAWWSNTANEMLLSHYGYNFDAMNEAEKFANVSPNNLERVKSLETSRMGIGWPIRAILSFVFYSPYLLVIYLIAFLVQKRSRIQSVKL